MNFKRDNISILNTENKLLESHYFAMIPLSDRYKKIVAFTLAEILITLLIIGVVASLVIPVLVQDIQNAQLKIAWKKTYADFEQATRLIMLDNSGSLKGVFAEDDGYDDEFIFANYMHVAKTCYKHVGGNCWPKIMNLDDGYSADTTSSSSPYSGFVLPSGAMISRGTPIKADCSGNTVSYQPDGGGSSQVPLCASFIVDVNGFKGPNKIGRDIFGFALLENKIVPYSKKILSTYLGVYTGYLNSEYYLVQ